MSGLLKNPPIREDGVGRRPPEFRDDEVVHTHRLGLTLRTVLTTAILEIADQLLLLGIDRDRRLPRGQRLLHLSIDVPKLGLAVGMDRPKNRKCRQHGENGWASMAK